MSNCPHNRTTPGECSVCLQSSQQEKAYAGAYQQSRGLLGLQIGGPRVRARLAAIEIESGRGRPDVVRFERQPDGSVRVSVAGYAKVDLTEDDFDALKMVFGA